MYIKQKISTKNIIGFVREYADAKRVLVVHSQDFDYRVVFAKCHTASSRSDLMPDYEMDRYYSKLADLKAEEFDLVVATGLIEHVPDPRKLVDDLMVLCATGGHVLIQASSAFAVHEAPHNFFHFTQYGIRELCKDYKVVNVSGSCGPYETIAILLQRIAFQTKSNPFIKAITMICANGFLLMDRFVSEQYGSMKRNSDTEIDSMLPSNVQIVLKK